MSETLLHLHNSEVPYDFHMLTLPGSLPCTSKLSYKHLVGGFTSTLFLLANAA